MDDNGRFALSSRLQSVPIAKISGKIISIRGLLLEAVGLKVPVGQLCKIIQKSGEETEAEVVGFNGKHLFLMSLSNTIEGIAAGNQVTPLPISYRVPVGDQLIGRVIDALGVPLDGRPLLLTESIPLSPAPLNPLARQPVSQPLMVGIRAIDSLLTLGKGQRVGLFAGSGLGKSTLLSMMTQYTEVDVTVIGLIGERSREVGELVNKTLGVDGLKQAVVIASPGDESPVRRVRAALYCHCIAEYFRNQGKSVLLLMDSLSRFAQALREVALAAGETPASRGFPPSVFSRIPLLIERAGPAIGSGFISAVYTVLAESDDMNDPIVDCARSALDGHIILSRSLAERGHYPAIDIEKSISRVMTNVVSQSHHNSALSFRRYHGKYHESRDLMAIGLYKKGVDPLLDKAIDLNPVMDNFLKQSSHEKTQATDSIRQLDELVQPKSVIPEAS